MTFFRQDYPGFPHEHPGMPGPRHRAGHIARHILGAAVIGCLFFFIFGYVVQYLWNGVMPAIFGVAHLTFWRAIGLLLLCRILVGGFHPRHGGAFGRRHRLSRKQYEDWWREAGQQSFHDYSSARTEEGKQP